MPTDRVVLIPGPQDEVDTVRRVFHWFANDRITEKRIAERLNECGPAKGEVPWNSGDVRRILVSERYLGNNVYNRSSSLLKAKKAKRMPPDKWVRSDGCYEALVSSELWQQAQQIYYERSLVLSDDDCLRLLRALYEKEGALSGVLINEQAEMPTRDAYRKRFGSLSRAYALIGYEDRTDRRYIAENKALRDKHPEVVQEVLAGLAAVGAETKVDAETGMLTVNNQWTATVSLARCLTSERTDRWLLRFEESLKPDITVSVRMAPHSAEPLDYYIFSRLHLEILKRGLLTRNKLSIDAFRFDDLSAFYELAARSPLGVAA